MGVDPQLVEEVAESLRDVPGQLAEMRQGSAMIGSRPTFQSMNAGQPGLILPGETTRRELEVVENSNALLNVPGGQMGIVTLSEMVRVGDRIENGRLVEAGQVWKLTTLPRPVEGNGQIVLGGPLIQPPPGVYGDTKVAGLSPEVADLIKKLNTVPRPPVNAKEAVQKAWASEVLPIFRDLFRVDDSEERPLWLTQQADVYYRLYDTGTMEAKWCQKQLANLRGVAENEAEEALPAIDQKSLFIEYSERREAMMVNAVNGNPPPAAAAAFQKWWTDAREKFIRDYPGGPGVRRVPPRTGDGRGAGRPPERRRRLLPPAGPAVPGPPDRQKRRSGPCGGWGWRASRWSSASRCAKAGRSRRTMPAARSCC